MASETTTMSNFVAHPITPLVKKPPEKYKTPAGAMDTTSEYKQKYEGKWGLPSQPILPVVTKEDPPAFDPSTTHSRDFTIKPMPPVKVYKSNYVYEPPKDAFNALTATNADFTDFGEVPKTLSLKPPEKPVTSDKPFNEVSSYSTSFPPPTMPKRFIRPRTPYVPSARTFTSSTTNRSDFCTHPLTDRLECIKPQENKFVDESPFENTTTNRQCYKPWVLPSRFSRPPTVYIPPTEKLSAVTTFKSAYQHHAYAPPSSNFKPEHRPSDQGPFDGRTTQAADYKEWSNVSRPPAIIHDKKYEPPTDKFEGITTFNAHYLGTPEPRAPSNKPLERSNDCTEKMESLTTYREEYSGSRFKICPAALLSDKANKDFAYSHEDATSGHKFYTPVPSSI